jgi:endonuclease III
MPSLRQLPIQTQRWWTPGQRTPEMQEMRARSSQGSSSRNRAVKRSDKAERILATLEQLYPTPAIPLQHRDTFTLLVAVVLSAQTTDKKVNQVTPQLFARAPTPEAMAQLSVPSIRELIREVGLAPQKAKALQGLSQLLIERHGSRVPDTFEALCELPGVGRKTANVILAQAFGQPAMAVDTHVHRLAARWGLSRGSTPDQTERDLCRIFPKSRWNDTHLRMVYFGREHCPALRHDLDRCPICSWAASKRRQQQELRKKQRLR